MMLCGVASYALTGGFDDVSGVGPGTDDIGAGGDLRVDFHRFTLPYCRSDDSDVEYFLNVINDSDTDVSVVCQFYYDVGTLVGTATGTVPARQSRGFTTANSGEGTWPEYPSSGLFFRDTTTDFEGFCRVLVGPGSGSAKNVCVTASLLSGLGDGLLGNANSVTPVAVFRADDADLDGDIDSRFKGD
jgi:hypothetical protein